MSKRLRVLVLMHEGRTPPEGQQRKEPGEEEDWLAEYHVVTTLEGMGHEVVKLSVSDELKPIRDAVVEGKPDIVFNLLDEFQGMGMFDQHVVAFLELLGVPYTGCNPRGLTLARDKGLTKKILTYHRIPVPDFAVFARGRKVKRPRSLGFPVIVKSLVEQASLGIAQASIVDDDDKLQERVRFIHETINTDAIAERYIAGRELYVSVVGRERLQVFPPWELVMDGLPPETAPIATRKIKWDQRYQRRHNIRWARAELGPTVDSRLRQLSRRIYNQLGLSGYGRMDFRMTDDEQIFLLEANPNPGIARNDEFPESAMAAGLSYERLLQRILNIGLAYVPGRIVP